MYDRSASISSRIGFQQTGVCVCWCWLLNSITCALIIHSVISYSHNINWGRKRCVLAWVRAIMLCAPPKAGGWREANSCLASHEQTSAWLCAHAHCSTRRTTSPSRLQLVAVVAQKITVRERARILALFLFGRHMHGRKINCSQMWNAHTHIWRWVDVETDTQRIRVWCKIYEEIWNRRIGARPRTWAASG